MVWMHVQRRPVVVVDGGCLEGVQEYASHIKQHMTPTFGSAILHVSQAFRLAASPCCSWRADGSTSERSRNPARAVKMTFSHH